MLYARRELTAAGARRSPAETMEADRLRELVSGPITDAVQVDEALDLLRRSPGLDEARRTLYDYADRARSLVAGLPDVPARAALSALVDLTVSRTR